MKLLKFEKPLVNYWPIIAITCLSAACDSHPSKPEFMQINQSSIPIPQALQRASLPANGDLSAKITINPSSGGKQHDMVIENNIFTFETELDDGEYMLQLDMFYQSPLVNQLQLVTASKSISIPEQTSLSFTEAEYFYIDSDGDLHTNLREIETETDPNDAESRTNDDNYEDNDAFSTAYNITGLQGVVLDSNLSTGFGFLYQDDQQDFFKMDVQDTSRVLEVEVLMDKGIDSDILIYDNETQSTELVSEVISSETLEDGSTFNTLRVNNLTTGSYYLEIYVENLETFLNTNPFGGYEVKWNLK